MSKHPFPYAYWTKVLGGLIMLAGVFSFFFQHHRRHVYDFNDLAVGLSWGLVFIFFSKERTDDEMVQSLKFKALTRSIIIAFFATHMYNYFFLNWQFERGKGNILSLSAYQYLALTLLLATGYFYWLKRRVTSNEGE
ncbi:hypothetical protein MKQ68_00720 [Chitinophaga horti]|uniref:DUF3796 domain-containing protein n=1 Tax=Chitinophaga horti TaxID=2920382 RepID=A0ABY6J4S6_9BACT|nr:hypothetical protein [Chitinophaga horti]UYQ93622.1 hypothetical protein MKQ68_00720 [Chitinophaga horti]